MRRNTHIILILHYLL